MSLSKQIREQLLSGGLTVASAKNSISLSKRGKVFEIWCKWVEIQFVEIHLLHGSTPAAILTVIQQHPADFDQCHWSLNRIQKIQIKLGVASQEALAPSEPFQIDPKRGWGVEIELLSRLSKHEVATKMEHAQLGVGVGEVGSRYYRRGDWKITDDGSLNASGMEIVSPILKGEKGFEQLKLVCNILKSCRAKIDTSCGLHIHHQVETPGVDDLKILQNAIYVYHKYQDYINRMLPASRRFNDTCEAHSSSDVRNCLRSQDTHNLCTTQNRHKAVNVRAYTRHGTCEFRQHSGSVEAEKIINWVIITQAVMKKAIQLARTSSEVSRYNFKKEMIEELKLKPEVAKYIAARIHHFIKQAA
jgi:hypothetical protein